jgi:hypothetical protein
MRAIVRRSAGLRVIQVMAVLLVGLVLAACGGGASQVLSTVGSSVGSPPIDQPAASQAPAAEVDGSGQVPDRSGSESGEVPLSAPRDDLKIVYTGSLQLVVDDLAGALARGKAAVLATGGYVGASQESNDGDRSVATITYRIPATRWEDAIADLRGLATKVVAEQTQATEVGGQLVDLDARIRNLRASEASLQEIATGAGKISDLLEVEAQLTAVRGQIEQLEGQRAQLQDQVAYGTLVTTFGLEVVQVQEQAQGWDPRQDVDGAFATLIGAGQAIVTGLIWFTIVWLPVIAVLVLVALAARWIFRRFVPAGGGSGGGSGPVPGWGEGPGGS